MKAVEKNVAGWSDVWSVYCEFANSKRTWVYRGLNDPSYHLETTLERTAKQFGIGPGQRQEIEESLLRWFKRQAHHFLSDVPAENDPIEWLAVMQHHGAPTRLLDWSFSFLVALFFAVEKAEASCVVWCLDLHWLLTKVEKKFQTVFKPIIDHDPRLKRKKFFKSVFQANPALDLVYSLNPNRLNPRLKIQQGIFLAAGNLGISFEDNFDTVQRDERGQVSKIVIEIRNPRVRTEILRHLYRMNINRATLFPGLDGFAQSLHTMMATPEILRGRLPGTGNGI